MRARPARLLLVALLGLGAAVGLANVLRPGDTADERADERAAERAAGRGSRERKNDAPRIDADERGSRPDSPAPVPKRPSAPSSVPVPVPVPVPEPGQASSLPPAPAPAPTPTTVASPGTGTGTGTETAPSSPATVTGLVLSSSTRAPVPGASVFSPIDRFFSTSSSTPGGASTTTGDDGRFSLSIPPGTGMLGVRGPDGKEVRSLPVRAQAGETVDLGEILLEPPGAVAGVVRLPDGRPAASIQVKLKERSVRTDAEGRFAFPDIPAGHYILAAELRPELAAGVQVRGGETAEVALGGEPQIVGRIRGPLGIPPRDRAAGALALGGIGGTGSGVNLIRAFTSGGGLRVPTDEEGRFAFGGLAPGRYAVGATWAYEEVEVPPPAPGAPPIELRVEPCVIRARFDGGPPGAPPPPLWAVHEDLFARGLAGDGTALVLATLGEPDRFSGLEYAPGETGVLVPRPGTYRLYPRASARAVASQPVRADASGVGVAAAVVPLAPATARFVVTDLRPAESALLIARDARTREIVAVERGLDPLEVRLPPGTYEVELLGEDGLRVRFDVVLDGPDDEVQGVASVGGSR